MCRLLAAHAVGRGLEILVGLTSALVEAAAGDPLLARLTGGDGRHCHGWGFAVASRRGGSWLVAHGRFDAHAPGVSGEESCMANLESARRLPGLVEGLLEGSEEAFLVAHVRRAGRREPRGTLHAHPYRELAHTPRGPVEVYLAHNGGVEKEPLAAELGVDAEEYSDSGLLAAAITSRIARGIDVAEALEWGLRLAKSGYVVALLTAPSRGDPELHVAAAASCSILEDEDRLEYYKPYKLVGEGLSAIASSTLARLAVERGLPVEADPVEPRDWGVYEVKAPHAPRPVSRMPCV